MDTFLRFKDQEVSKKFHSDGLTTNLVEQANSFPFIMTLVLTVYVFNSAIELTITPNDTLTWAGILWEGGANLIRILLYFLSRKYQTPKTSLLFDLGWLVTSIAINLKYLVFLDKSLPLQQALKFVVGILFSFSFTRGYINGLLSQGLLVLSLMLMFSVNPTLNEVADYTYYITIGLQFVIIMRILTIREKTRRKFFIDKCKARKAEDSYKYILNEIPENIIVLDSRLNEKFVNRYFKQTFNSLEEEATITILKRINDITVRTSHDLSTSTPESSLDDDRSELTPLVAITKQNMTLYDACQEANIFGGLYKYLENLKRQGCHDSLVADCKYNALNTTKVRSIELKIAISQFSNEDCMVFILKETTQRDVISRLTDNNNYKDRLLASVSHELRTPLNANINFLQIALQEPSIDSGIKEKLLTPAIRGGKLLMHIINDILDYSQINAHQFRLVFTEGNIKQTCQECVELIQIQANAKKIDLQFEYDEDIAQNFSTDHNRVSQILLNLLSNALKFTFKGGIKLKVESNKRNVKFSVSDTGIGIKENDQQKLFQAFGKIDLGQDMRINARGVGLGLAISNAVVKLLGPADNSNIQFQSTYGAGSTFSFELTEKFCTNPTRAKSKIVIDDTCDALNEFSSSRLLISKHMAEITRSIMAARKSSSDVVFHEDSYTDIFSPASKLPEKSIFCSSSACKCAPVLVVDDDSFNIMTLTSLCKLSQVTCDASYNGYEAIEMVLARHANPCSAKCQPYKVILMDCSMPVIDGFETTKLLRARMKEKQLQRVMVIACTAMSAEQIFQECAEADIDSVLTKPLERAKLNEVIELYVKC